MRASSQVIGNFKQCPLCQDWFSDQDIFSGPSIKPIGMLLDPAFLDISMYFFNHASDGCWTTFTINVEKFTHFLEEPIIRESNTLSASCEGHCFNLSDTGECSQTCKWAPFRRLLRAMLEIRNLSKSQIEDIVKR